jgi:hypothetical protein
MASTIDEARTPSELAEWLRLWAKTYEEGVDYLDDNDARQLAEVVERVCAPCNAAAIREALETILAKHNKMILPEICCPNCGEDFQLYGNLPPEIEQQVRAALATPPRNCDVGTPEEQEKRFESFCNSHWDLNDAECECAGCPLNCRVGTECEFAWAQMPYEGKGATDGSK